MARNNLPFFRGEDVVLKFYQDGSPVYLAATNWSVEQNATEVAEGVNGEVRDRLDLVTNYYSASVDVNQTDQEVMDALIAAQQPQDNHSLPLSQVAGIQIKNRDGTRAAYKLTGVVLGPWSKAMSGRADPVKLTLKMRFTNYDKVNGIG